MRSYVHATYKGHQTRLSGKTALVQINREDPTRCTAQFDDQSLPEAFGWWAMGTKDFAIRPSELAEYWDVQGRN